jgi:hypothetical protein
VCVRVVLWSHSIYYSIGVRDDWFNQADVKLEALQISYFFFGDLFVNTNQLWQHVKVLYARKATGLRKTSWKRGQVNIPQPPYKRLTWNICPIL